MILLLLAAQMSDPDLLMRNARSLLAAPCVGVGCAPSASARFRVTDEDDAADVTAKDRAIRDDGSKCNVVGARRCPKRGRTLFRTAIDR